MITSTTEIGYMAGADEVDAELQATIADLAARKIRIESGPIFWTAGERTYATFVGTDEQDKSVVHFRR
ncbi:hypothetical protein GCM10009785_33670 [Brooklawnia cerclae]|uniref:Uncharacterized protein n=1 Tax=Brooklawnia cerclae TaxID=349934 RepID=A0ABX0SBL6_9ACTN|nr:hypothetical protein [Brooklawnia cerclae]NIH55719.1 hypothetical protein [Brooklawnia cerclae]